MCLMRLKFSLPLPPSGSFFYSFALFLANSLITHFTVMNNTKQITSTFPSTRSSFFGVSSLTNQPTLWNRIFLEILTVTQLVKKFTSSYRSQRFISIFRRRHHWCTYRYIHSTPSHYTSLRSILILFSHLRLGLSSGLFSSGF